MAEKKAEQFYTPPPKLGKWEGFRIFIWNSETHQFLGRTGASWGKILLFYVIFYCGLIGFFVAMMVVFYQTIDMKIPKWQQDKSVIGNNPGLGFRPMPPESNVESTLIWYRANDEQNYKYWTEELDKFLEVYKHPGSVSGEGKNIVDCDKTDPGDKVCYVDPKEWSYCSSENHYSYHRSAPCIFLKLNKIYGWVPEYYNDSDSLPGKMPKDLKDHIKDTTDPRERNTVWVSCEGENPADVENIGPIQYIPRRGFPGYFFPFTNKEGYLSPLVAVWFERPKTGVLINIECKAWAHNVRHDRAERRGSVHFELMVD
ncbi:hypothetical protein Cfor_04666 [Coptotermes formosanus]|uniref:Sodium/potassium-transporting ATPase subunit beta-2 n=1 Tax=Coptotermes formosanus TaxID=36987 RepID=A0A6L2PAZ6_COPFO|nr:hypothetical protein Cfor_04666 [Coptotermes formosanus]